MEFTPEDLARFSFKFFFVRILGYKWARHHNEWYQLLKDNKRILIECARGHGKTVFFVAYSIWLVYQGNPVDILFISYSEEQVKNNIMNLIEKIIMTNEYLARLRPSTRQQWGSQLKTFSTGAQIRGESFGSSVRGAHPSHLFIDDPLKDKGGMTPEEQYNYFMTSLMGTVKRETQVVVDGTPLDPGDLLEQLERNPSFIFRAYPSENEERTLALFPELFTLDELRQIEKEVGSFAYSRERLLKRIDPKSQVFKDGYRTINEKQEYPDFKVVRTLIDPAISEKDNACDSAIVTAGLDQNNEIWEIDTRLEQSDNPKKILDSVVSLAKRLSNKFSDYSIVIEGEVFQKVLAFDLRKELVKQQIDTGVIEVVHSGNTGKHQRIMGLQPEWEARAIHILPESPLIAQFRYYRPNIKGFKIDGLDALSWIKSLPVGGPQFNHQPVDPGVPDSAYD